MRRSGGLEPLAECLVVLAVRAHAGRQRRVPTGLRSAAGLLERAPQAKVGVVVHRVALQHRCELDGGLLEACRAEVRPAERFTNRALLGLQRACALERYRSGHEVAALQQLAALLDDVVSVLAPRSSFLLLVAARWAGTWYSS